MKRLIKPVLVVTIAAVLFQAMAPTIVYADPDNLYIYYSPDRRYKTFKFEFYSYNVRIMQNDWHSAYRNAYAMVWRALNDRDTYPNLGPDVKLVVAFFAAWRLYPQMQAYARQNYRFGQSMFWELRVDTWTSRGVSFLDQLRQAASLVGTLWKVWFEYIPLTGWQTIPLNIPSGY